MSWHLKVRYQKDRKRSGDFKILVFDRARFDIRKALNLILHLKIGSIDKTT